jgi:peptidylprolyl isomerase
MTKNDRAAAKRAAAERATAQRAAAAKRRQLMTIAGAALAVLLVVGVVAAIAGGVGPFAKDTVQTSSGGFTVGKDKPTVAAGEGDVTELKVTTLKEGTGAVVKKGQTISVHYLGVTYKDGKKFDSSWDRGQPAEFAIGVGQVIPGWDEGLVGVKVGSRVQLDIPADKAYGEKPASGPGGDLRFVVDILAAK